MDAPIDPSSPLDAVYENGGLMFRYPGYWQMEEFTSDEEHSATVLTDNSAFWMVSLIRDVGDVDAVLDSALAAFEDEYEDLDIYERVPDKPPGWTSQELEFQYQDLVSSVVLQSIAGGHGALLVLYQGHDRDLEEHQAIFEQMTASVLLQV